MENDLISDELKQLKKDQIEHEKLTKSLRVHPSHVAISKPLGQLLNVFMAVYFEANDRPVWLKALASRPLTFRPLLRATVDIGTVPERPLCVGLFSVSDVPLILTSYPTGRFDEFLTRLNQYKNILVLVGAGISTAAGIPGMNKTKLGYVCSIQTIFYYFISFFDRINVILNYYDFKATKIQGILDILSKTE